MIAARSPRCIATRPGLLARAWRSVRSAWLRWEIWAAEDWIKQCAGDGILQSRSLRECRRQIEELRVQLALLENGQ